LETLSTFSMQRRAGPDSDFGLWTIGLVAAAIVAAAACAPARASAEADRFQQAVNYVFTGRIDPPNAPEVVDRDACVVVVPDPRFKRYIRYYLGRFRFEDALFDKRYAGSREEYVLDVRGDDVIVEYLGADKQTVAQSYRSAQISLPGDIDQTRKALQIVSDSCKSKKSNAPF
jgi:hypothetical protein